MAAAGERAALRVRGGRRGSLVAGVLVALLAAEAGHEAFGIGGSGLDTFFDQGVHDFLFFAAAGLCFLRAATVKAARGAWTMIGLSLLTSAFGELVWSVFYAGESPAPFPTAADGFWLAYYPLVGVGLALLVRDRIEGFELDRWIDGLAAALIVATPAVAYVFQPVLEESHHGTTLGRAIELTYPIGDILVLGAVTGIFALTAWRPGRMWLLLGLGLATFAIVDSVNAVQTIRGIYPQGTYDYVWSAAMLLIAYAAWQPDPPRAPPVHLVGWREVALPIACQLVAAGIQVYGIFHHIPDSERVVTSAILLLVVVQLWVTRPREP